MGLERANFKFFDPGAKDFLLTAQAHVTTRYSRVEERVEERGVDAVVGSDDVQDLRAEDGAEERDAREEGGDGGPRGGDPQDGDRLELALQLAA